MEHEQSRLNKTRKTLACDERQHLLDEGQRLSLSVQPKRRQRTPRHRFIVVGMPQRLP